VGRIHTIGGSSALFVPRLRDGRAPARLAETLNKMKKIIPVSFLTVMLVCPWGVYASDGFESVHCGSDVRKALLGRTMSNERVVVLEAKHKDLGLKDLGASEISDQLSLISWLICGDEYVLLEERNIVRDVLKFPKHSTDMPQFVGPVQIHGQEQPGTAIGLLKNEKGVEILPVVAAWKIDEKEKKFVKLATEGLRSSRDGIITIDGGR
jgi:hypothetical protein